MPDIKNILKYEGYLNLDIIEMLLYRLKNKISKIETNIAVRKRLFSIIVECLDNIQKHNDPFIPTNRKEYATPPSFSFDFNNNFYFISTKNVILHTNIVLLQSKLDLISGLDKEGLSRLYEEVITSGKLSHKGGAGLGFIDIAKKSGNNIEYSFENINNHYSYFYFKVKIPKNKQYIILWKH